MNLLRTLALLSIAAGLAGASQEKPGIYVQVDNLRNSDGSLRCGLFESEENWLGESPREGARVTIREGRATCAFEGIEKGVFALTALHDEDDDGEMDKSVLGLPQEGYGASRGAVRKGVAAPDWEDAKFRYRGGVKRLKIRLKYP